MEGYTHAGLVYQGHEPYPPVQAEGRNWRLAAAMLDNAGGRNSEMSAVAMYLYDGLVTAEMEEVAESFRRISVVEMHHLEIFGTLAHQLGEDPRMWGVNQGRKSWWTPGYLQYPRRLDQILRAAIREEKGAIRKYRAQARWAPDRNVGENLRRIVEDEEQHLLVLELLYQTYAVQGFSALPPTP